MALPWMESLRAGDEPLSTANPVFPKRFAALCMGNGINADHWWAKGAGEEMELSRTLEQLDPFKKKLNVITGLFNRNANGYCRRCVLIMLLWPSAEELRFKCRRWGYR